MITKINNLNVQKNLYASQTATQKAPSFKGNFFVFALSEDEKLIKGLTSDIRRLSTRLKALQKKEAPINWSKLDDQTRVNTIGGNYSWRPEDRIPKIEALQTNKIGGMIDYCDEYTSLEGHCSPDLDKRVERMLINFSKKHPNANVIVDFVKEGRFTQTLISMVKACQKAETDFPQVSGLVADRLARLYNAEDAIPTLLNA